MKQDSFREATDHAEPSFVGELLRSAVYSALEAPLLGLAQLSSGCNTPGVMRTESFFAGMGVHAPEPARFNSERWYAQTIGSAVGDLLPFCLIRGRLRKLMGVQATSVISEQAAIGMSIKEAALTGFVSDAFLKPSKGDDLLTERFKTGLAGALTMSVLTAGSLGVGGMASSTIAQRLHLRGLLQNPVVSGVLGSAPGGLVAPEIDAVSRALSGDTPQDKRRWVPTPEEAWQSVWGMAFVGAAFGLQSWAFGEPGEGPGIDINRAVAVEEKPDEPAALRSDRALALRPAELLERPEVKELIAKELPPVQLPDFMTGPNFEPAAIPKATGLEGHDEHGDPIYGWRLGTIRKTSDGMSVVEDAANLLTRVFDASGKLVQVTSHQYLKPLTQSYAYDSAGELRAIQIAEAHGWFRTKNGWAQGILDRSTGTLHFLAAEDSFAAIDAEGGVIIGTANGAYSIPVNSRHKQIDRDKVQVTHVDGARERAITDRLIDRVLDDRTRVYLKSLVERLKENSGAAIDRLFSQVNSELTRGSPNAYRLLNQFDEYVKRGINNLQSDKMHDGEYVMTASIIKGDKTVQLFADGSESDVYDGRRVTRLPNGNTVVSTDEHSEEHDEHSRLIKSTVRAGSHTCQRQVNYDNAGKLTGVKDDLSDRNNVLEESDGVWLLHQQINGQQNFTRTLVVGKGSVRQQGLFDVTFSAFDQGKTNGKTALTKLPSAIENHQRIVKLEMQGSGQVVTTTADGRETLLVPGEDAVVVKADLKKEKSTFYLAIANFPDRKRLKAATSRLLGAFNKSNIPDEDRAVFLSEVNRQMSIAPEQTLQLLEEAGKLAGESSPGTRISVIEKDAGGRIRIGNQAIDWSTDGQAIKVRPDLLRFKGMTSLAFKTQVTSALQKLDPAIINLLCKQGVTVSAAEKVSDVGEAVANQNAPEGWTGDQTLKNLDSFFDPARREAMVLERFEDAFDKTVIDNQDVGADTLYATGEAVDHALGGFSNSDEFVDPYRSDRDRWFSSFDTQFYLGDGGAGARQHVFSQLFANLHGASNTGADEGLSAAFPKSAQAIQRRLAELSGQESPTVKTSVPQEAQSEPIVVDRRNEEAPAVGDLLNQDRGVVQPEPTAHGSSVQSLASMLSLYKPRIPEATVTDGRQRKDELGSPEFHFDDQGRLEKRRSTDSDLVVTREADGTIVALSSSSPSGASLAWKRVGNSWQRVTVDSRGVQVEDDLGPGRLSVSLDGAAELVLSDGTVHKLDDEGEETVISPNGRTFQRKVTGRTNYLTADLSHEKQLLTDRLEKKFGWSDYRRRRFISLLEQFEKAAKERNLPEERQAVVLWQLNRLVHGVSRLVISLSARGDLAEQLLKHAADQSDLSQGSNLCNVTTVYKRLQALAPEKAAQMVADMVLDGSYTRADGSAVAASEIVGGVNPDAQSMANLEVQADAGAYIIDGTRDWAGQIAQSLLVHAAWLDKPIYLAGSTQVSDRTIGKIRTPGAVLFDDFGAVKVSPGSTVPFDPRRSELPTVWSPESIGSTILGRTLEKGITRLYDEKGSWLGELKPGQAAYDADGQQLVTRVAPGDVSWGPSIMGYDGLVLRKWGVEIPLRDTEGYLKDFPRVYVEDLSGLYASITGEMAAGPAFVLTSREYRINNAINLDSVESLAQHLQELKSRQALPAILLVDAGHYPFNQGAESAGHVINVYDYSPESGKVRYSNSWGAKYNNMGEGLPIEQIFQAMQSPLNTPGVPQTPAPLKPLPLDVSSWFKLD